MITKQKLTSFLFVASLGIAAGVAAFSPTEASAGGECSKGAKSSEFPEVKKACAGGQTAAKKMMKDIEKKAKKRDGKGHDWKCNDCHENKKDYKLKSDAEDKYKTWRKLGGY